MDQLKQIEQLSNELSNSELKGLIATKVSLEGRDPTIFSEKVYVRAKLLVTSAMLEKGQTETALKYLKKTIFSHNRNFRVQAQLLERAAKLLLRGQNSLSVKDFTKKVLRDVALDKVTARTFEHLKTFALLNNLPASDTVEIYEAKVACSAFAQDAEAWIDYFGFLRTSGLQAEAKRVKERAIAACTDKQAILNQCVQ